MSGTVLLTGASGRLGQRLTTRLQEEGWRVRALVHRTSAPAADEHVDGSITESATVEDALRGCVAVIHLAAVTHARDDRRYREANVGGTERVVWAAERAGIDRLVHISSRAATLDGGWYSRSKLAAESAVSSSALDWTIVRLPELYGASGPEGLDDIIRRARSGRSIFVVGRGEQRICPMHVDDAVTACAHALRAEPAVHKTYTLGGPCLTVREFAGTCVEAASTSARIVAIPEVIIAVAALAARVLPLPLYPDQPARLRSAKPLPSGEAERELSFTMRSLRDGLNAVR